MAGTIARAYRGPNNLSDWYLPSKDELNQMYLQKGAISGLPSNTYWSSSENSSVGAWAQIFFTGRQTFYAKDGGGGSGYYVRPVRAFG